MSSWQQQKHLEELAQRRLKQEENRDHELEQCVIAYHAFRVDGGQGKFADFQRDWLKQRAVQAG